MSNITKIPQFLEGTSFYPPDHTYQFTGEFLEAPRHSSKRIARRNNPTVYYPLYKNSKGHEVMASQFLSKEEYQAFATSHRIDKHNS